MLPSLARRIAALSTAVILVPVSAVGKNDPPANGPQRGQVLMVLCEAASAGQPDASAMLASLLDAQGKPAVAAAACASLKPTIPAGEPPAPTTTGAPGYHCHFSRPGVKWCHSGLDRLFD